MPLNLSTDEDAHEETVPYSDLVDVAIVASKAAGDIIVNYKGGAEVTKTKANSKDLLTMVDPMCEKIIREIILERFPSHSILGEEDVAPGKEVGGYRPLGFFNFLYLLYCLRNWNS